MFTNIARDIARSKPPEWLVLALDELACHVATAGLYEKGDPKRAQLRSRFLRMQTAAKKMDRALDAIRGDFFWITFTDLDTRGLPVGAAT